MSVEKKIFLCLLLMLLNGCNYSITLSDFFNQFSIFKDFPKEMEQKHGLKLFSYGMNPYGNGLRPNNNSIEGFTFTFRSNEKLTVPEARKLLVTITEELLALINNDPKMRKQIGCYPLTYEQVELSITFNEIETNYYGPEFVESCHLLNNGLVIYWMARDKSTVKWIRGPDEFYPNDLRIVTDGEGNSIWPNSIRNAKK